MEVIARQDDTVDMLCQRYYGYTGGVTEQVLMLNPGLCRHGAILPMGTRVNLPDQPVPQVQKRIQLWQWPQ